MTSKETATTENEALSARAAALEQEVAALKGSVRRASRIRLLLLLAVVVFLAGSVWMFYGLAKDFGSKENLDLLTAKAKERAESSSDQARKELEALIQHCQPVLVKAFQERAQADMPKYQEALAKEGDELAKNLEAELRAKLDSRYREAAKKYQGILQEEFPELDDPELTVQLYASITDIMERLAEKYYSEQLERELKEMSETWERLEMAELPAQGDPALEQQFMASLLQVAALRLDEKSAPQVTDL